MKLRHLLFAALLIPFMLISCKTTTPGSPESLVKGKSADELAAPPNDTELAALADARAKAEDARAKAEYVKAGSYYPDEWGPLEDRYTAAASQDKPASLNDLYQQVVEWKALETAYDALYKKSLEQFCAEQQQVLADARQKAIDAGAQDLVPDRLAQADTLAASAQDKYEKKEYEDSVADGKAAYDRYMVLTTLAQAHAKRMEADKENFSSADPDNYKLATDAGNNAIANYDSGSLKDAQDAADESLLRFNLVLKNGWAGRLSEKAAAAKDARDAAVQAKANVAVKSDFSAADNVYNQARAAQSGENYSTAASLYDQAATLFQQCRDSAEEKRQAAEEAMKKAEDDVQKSNQKAQDAETTIGGGEE